MQYISVYDSKNPDCLIEYFYNRVSNSNLLSKEQGVVCKINDFELTLNAFVDVLSEYIWEIVLPQIAGDYLKKNFDIYEDVAVDIMTRAMHIAYGMRAAGDVVKDCLMDYITPSVRIILIDGFFQFRLKNLKMDMEALVTICYRECCEREEYKDFTELIKEVIETQPSVYDEIYIIEHNNVLKIMSGSGNDITAECINMYLSDADECVTYQDCVISSIITIAPKKIFVRCSDLLYQSSFIETLSCFFPGRIVLY